LVFNATFQVVIVICNAGANPSPISSGLLCLKCKSIFRICNPSQSKFLSKSITSHIEESLKTKDTYFVIVGTGHLIGKKGIVEMLRAKGNVVK
jgi:hypothetical protein